LFAKLNKISQTTKTQTVFCYDATDLKAVSDGCRLKPGLSPATVKAIVMMRFPKLSIAFAEKSVSSSGTSFLISLNDGTDLEFSPSGTCTSVHNQYQDFHPILL